MTAGMDSVHIVNCNARPTIQIVSYDIYQFQTLLYNNRQFFFLHLPHQMHPPCGKYPGHICPDHMHDVVGILHRFVTSESD